MRTLASTLSLARLMTSIAFAPDDGGAGGAATADQSIDNSDADLAPLVAEINDVESWEQKTETFITGLVAKLLGLSQPVPVGQPDITADQLKTKIAALATDLQAKTSDFKSALQTDATNSGAGPSVNSISPTSGPEAGGDTVVLTGSGFGGALAVNFGGSAAASFTVDSDTQITAVTPAGTGSAVVAVQGPVSLSAKTATYSFTPAAPVAAAPVAGAADGTAEAGVQQQVQ